MRPASAVLAPVAPVDVAAERGAAWLAFALTAALMVVDFIDRQVVVALFPYLRTDWGLSDAQLGALVSVVSVTVALGALPVAWLADRHGRVRCIAAMASVWSLATLAAAASRGWGSLLACRALVGLGEAGYGAVGAALLGSHFRRERHGTVLAAFLGSATLGSVLGVALGGCIAAHWGWRAALGVVGLPGLLLALLYLRVREGPHAFDAAGGSARPDWRALLRTPGLAWLCLGAAAQLIVVSALWAWLPSYLHRTIGSTPAESASQAALVILAGGAGGVLCGYVVDRVGRGRMRVALRMTALLCVVCSALLVAAFAGPAAGSPAAWALLLAGGGLVSCSVGPVAAAVLAIAPAGLRATGAALLALVQNLCGLAVGPLVAGLLSDAFGLPVALALTPSAGLMAAGLLAVAAARVRVD